MDIGNKQRVIIVEPLEEPAWDTLREEPDTTREDEGSGEHSGVDSSQIWAGSTPES